jgi:Na+-driven multidrug efflux pump
MCLRSVGPFYGFFGLGLVLDFASQGVGKLLWPVLAKLLRLAVAALGGWLVLCWGGTLTQVFLVQGLTMVVYGLLNAGAVAAGSWFGPLRWPRRAAAA